MVGNWSRETYHRKLMDLDHERCRRTDGRKWRCYLSVVPDKKYCEKHMHRGRKRSRKLVEDITLDKPYVVENLNKIPMSTPGFIIPATVSKKLQPLRGPSSAVIKCPALANTSAKITEKTAINIEGTLNMLVNERIAAVNLASGLLFSPKSVLQDGQRCSEINRHVKAKRTAPQRCRRTDGRKWQCQNEALPTQKYCVQHINRGQKYPVMSLLPSSEAKAAHVTSSTTKLSGPEQSKMGLGLGMGLVTDLNISVPVNVRDSAYDSTSSSDYSTETATSDDSPDISNLIDVSP